MRTRLALAAVLWSAGALAGSQAQVKETLTVNVVEVPVTVVDHDGAPVRGLTAANFKILDEGVERKVSAFDAVDFASVESLKATSPLNPAARRNFMLLFDLSFSSPSSIKRAQLAARDFVTKMVQRRDRVAVGTVDADKGFRLVTAFTTDRTLLNAAIANPATFRGEDPLQIAGRLNVEDARAAASNDQGMNAPAELNETLRRMNRNEDQFNRARVDRQIGLITGLAKSLRAIAGQKNIVLLSEGFDPRLVQGRTAGLSVEQLRDNEAIEHGRVWDVDNDNRFGSAASISILDKMAEACRRSDVILHAVDIKGIRTDVDARTGFQQKSNEGLYVLANASGGSVFKNANNLSSDFDRVIKHHEVSYVLAFNAPT